MKSGSYLKRYAQCLAALAKQPHTRNELAALTGMDVQTVSKWVKCLDDEKLLSHGYGARPDGGSLAPISFRLRQQS